MDDYEPQRWLEMPAELWPTVGVWLAVAYRVPRTLMVNDDEDCPRGMVRVLMPAFAWDDLVGWLTGPQQHIVVRHPDLLVAGWPVYRALPRRQRREHDAEVNRLWRRLPWLRRPAW